MAQLPRDIFGNAVPVLGIVDGGSSTVAVSGTTARSATDFTVETEQTNGYRGVVTLYATEDCFIRFGDDTVVATTGDTFLAKGIYFDVALAGTDTRVAAIQDSTGGNLHIIQRA